MAECSSSTTIVTRKKTDIWLVGQTSSTFSQTKLPSKKEVLSVFFYYKEEQKQTVRESAHFTSIDVLDIWNKARIPTRLKKHVVEKLEKLFKEWQNLKKNKENKARRSVSLKERESNWSHDLDELFDIAHADALQMIKIEEDKQFLLAQRQKGRRGKMGSIDKKLAKKERELESKKACLEKLKEKEKQDIKRLTEKVSIPEDSNTSDSDCKSDSSEDTSATELVTRNNSTRKRGRKEIINDNLAICLDVSKLSDRNASLVLTSTLKQAGCDPSLYNVNYSSVRRQRIKRREALAKNLKTDFSPDVLLTVHWDGKMLEDISGHEIVDRLPILVSGQNIDQLLAVPKLESGSGELIATAVYEEISSWGISDKVKCMCFDTTAVNTGRRNGACILLEQKMQKEMLWLPCRHHILEIMLEAVIVQEVGPSTGPDILLFKRFKKFWPQINSQEFEPATTDPLASDIITDFAQEIITFSKDQLQKFQPRDDYKELLELNIIFLGGTLEKKLSFKAPAGVHRARWMAKAIYSLKIYLFRSQFQLTKREETGIRNICIFSAAIYIKNWFQATSAVYAPLNDLQLLKDLVDFKNINETLADKALNKIKNHLWYLSETLVALSFFDKRVTNETKSKMVTALQNNGFDYQPLKPTVDLEVVPLKSLDNFVSNNTMNFFKILDLGMEFINSNVENWDQEESYKKNMEVVKSIRVVNDIAERGVALIEEFNKLITMNEEQKQFLIQVVKEFRKRFPDRKKETLLKMF